MAQAVNTPDHNLQVQVIQEVMKATDIQGHSRRAHLVL
jgi:hypothetical protein